MSWGSRPNNSDTGCLPAFVFLMALSTAMLVLFVVTHFVVKYW